MSCDLNGRSCTRKSKAQRQVEGDYRLKDKDQIAFQVGPYDASRPLIIDAVLSYSSYLAGTDDEASTHVVVDDNGNAYITGATTAADLPTKRSLVSGFAGGLFLMSDGFVIKLNPDPRYVAEFSAAMAKVSGVDPNDDEAGPALSAHQQSAGVGLLGTNSAKQGMSCIGCHGFRDKAPLGEDGPHLSQTGERLRFDWFQRWMRNPARILSGTSMPNYFSSTPPGEADKTIETLWAAFSMGARMPLPGGFRTQDAAPHAEARPIPGPEAIVLRYYMPEATPAAIAVGLPDNVSYCFDAGEVRLRYAWLGGFVDMTGALIEKRDSATGLTRTADLLGEIFYRTTEFPIRIGSLDRIPQRRFRGYRMIDGRPRFHYQVNGIDVYERVVAVDGNRGIVRQFTIAQVEWPAWFLVGNPEGVEATSTLGQPVEGTLEIPQGREVRFDVTILKRGVN